MSDKSVRKVLDWPSHREGSKIGDPIRFEEVGCPECGCPDCEHCVCEDCTCSDCFVDLSPSDTGKGRVPTEKEQEPSEFTDTHCPDCGQDLAELASEEQDAHILKHHPEYREKWFPAPRWEAEEQGAGNTKYKEVPNEKEGGSDYFSEETGEWVTWGNSGLMDEEIDQALKDNPTSDIESGDTIIRQTPADREDVAMIEDKRNYPVCPKCNAVSSLLYDLDPVDGHVTRWYCDACGYATENLKDFRPAKGEEEVGVELPQPRDDVYGAFKEANDMIRAYHKGERDALEKVECPLCDAKPMHLADLETHVYEEHFGKMEEQGDESYGSGASQGQGWEGQGGGTENQQLNPTTEQNISPFTQSQFVPTGSQIRYPTPKKEAQYDMSYSVTEGDNAGEIEKTSETYNTQDAWKPVETPQWAGMQPAGKGEAEGHCDSCGGWGDCRYSDLTQTMLCRKCRAEARELDRINHLEQGDVDNTIEPEEVDGAACSFDCCPSQDCDCDDCDACSWFAPSSYTEELRDPRVDPDEKGKAKDKELSPEAQKIAGTDPATQKTKEKAKPKLEVDVSDKISILGKTGSGKTNLIKVLMSDILKDYAFVLLDSIGNFAEYEGKPNIEYHQVVPSDTNAVDEIIYAALEKGNCMVVIDEVDRYQTKKGTMLNELVNLGRNYNVGGIFAARRTADVDKDILSNSPYIFVFQHILPQDLDVLIDWFAQPEQTFRDLQEFEAILFKNGEEVWKGRVPEKPTTKPTGKPNLPKKPKGSDKDKEKGKDKPSDKDKEPEQPESASGSPTEPDEVKEKGAPELPTPPGEIPEEEPEPTHEFESQKEEGAFRCEYDNKTFKWEKDFLEHVNSHVMSV